jgi:hypothetical protein
MAGGSREDDGRDDDASAGNSERVVRQRVHREAADQPTATTQAADEQVAATERATTGNAATSGATPSTGRGQPAPLDDQDSTDPVATSQSRRNVDEILKDAEQRDSVANVRDSAANRRDVEANLDALLKEEPDEAGFEARAWAKKDRSNSRHDREASAEDRTELTTDDPPPKK